MVIEMSNVGIAFLLTIMAGLSTLMGCIVIFFKGMDHNKIIANSLAFASGVMLCVSVIDLIPESLNLISKDNYWVTVGISIIFVFLGIVGSNFLDKMINNSNSSLLYKTGILSMIAIIIHNVPEGIITFITANNNIRLGISLTIAIALHNIPEGISISVPIYYATGSKIKAIFYTLISALSEPLGAILTYLFLINFINNFILGILFSLIAGIMLYIAIFNLIPTAKKYQYARSRFYFFIFGIIVMIIQALI